MDLFLILQTKSNMDNTILLFATGILAVAAIPFAMMAWQRRKRHAQLKQRWQDWAQRCGLQPGLLHCSGHVAIGFDHRQQWLLCHTDYIPPGNYDRIDLQQVKDCRLVQTTQQVNGTDGVYSLMDSIGLQFDYHQKSRASEYVLLYDSNGQRIPLTDQLELARNWQQKVIALIKASGG